MAVLVTTTALGLSGCGGGIGLSSATFTTPPPIPGEITQTATRTAVPSPSVSSATATRTPAKPPVAAKPAAAKPATAKRITLRADEQRVTVRAAGITFGAPLTLGRVDSAAMLDQSASSPQMKALAARLGMSTTTLRDGLLRQTDTIMVGSTVLIVMHLPLQELPDDGVLKQQLEFGSGGTVTKIRHVSTKAGPAVRASYTIRSGSMTLAGDALMIRTRNGIANISTTATSASASDAVVRRVVATVQPLR